MQAMCDDSGAINGFTIGDENQYQGNVEDIYAENAEGPDNIFQDCSMMEDIHTACDLAQDSAENGSECTARRKEMFD